MAPTKRDILNILGADGRERTASDIADAIGASWPTVSMTLLRLFRSGLVTRRGRGGGFGGVFLYAITERGRRRLAYWRHLS